MSQETNDLLREILLWVRFQSLDRAKAAVADLLDTDKKKIVFEHTDGKSSSRGLAAKCSVDRNAVLRWWGEWFTAGIVVKQDEGYRKLFSLRELGIKLPETLSTKAAEADKP